MEFFINDQTELLTCQTHFLMPNHWQPAVSASRHWKQKLQLKQNETKAYSTVRHTVTTTSGERPTSPSRWHYNWLTFEPCYMLDTVLYKQASTNLWNWPVAHPEKYLSSRKEWEENQPFTYSHEYAPLFPWSQ